MPNKTRWRVTERQTNRTWATSVPSSSVQVTRGTLRRSRSCGVHFCRAHRPLQSSQGNYRELTHAYPPFNLITAFSSNFHCHECMSTVPEGDSPTACPPWVTSPPICLISRLALEIRLSCGEGGGKKMTPSRCRVCWCGPSR